MRKNIFILICCFCFSVHVKAQWYDPDKVNAKASTIYNMAVDYARNEKYTLATKMLNDAIQLEPKYVDGYLSLAAVNANVKNYNASITNFEKAFALDSVYSRDFLLPYSISLAGAGRFNDALFAVNKFLESNHLNNVSRKAGEFRKSTYNFAIDYAAQHISDNYNFNPINLGDSINTSDLEYFPSLTIDAKQLVFTKRIKGVEQFYESLMRDDGKWSKAKLLDGNISSYGFNEGAQNISQDGQCLVFTGCNFPGGLGSCDIYISYMTKQGWSTPENLGPNVNSEFWESSPSLSPDKQDLYFSSNIPGGKGGKDIWVSHRNKDGSWGSAKNLGAQINTSGDESCPFIHADNQTLYFNSTGHPGYSEKPDIYVTHKLSDGSWTIPVNLGYPINTIDDEGSLIVAGDGKTAYYSSDRIDTKGGLDIYKFELRKDLRPVPTIWIKGKVFDEKTKSGLPSSILLTNVSTQQVISKLQTDEEGNYLSTIPIGANYAFHVMRKGYLFYSENLDVQAKDPNISLVKDIPLKPIEVNANMILKNIFYDSKQSKLKSESIAELDNVVRFMNENPKVKILISGYTDNIGKPADNLKLSMGRAVSVVNYLLDKGIRIERLTFKGFGDSLPISSNTTENGRSSNRRTELKITAN